MKKPCDIFIQTGTRSEKFNEYILNNMVNELKEHYENKPFICSGDRNEYYKLKKKKKLRKILILIIIIETFIYLVLSQIIIFKNSNTIKENEKLIKELEENRNTLISENSYLKIQNMNLWEYYYTNNSK